MCIFLHSKNLLYFCDNFQHWFNWRWRLCTIKLWIKTCIRKHEKDSIYTLLIVVVATGVCRRGCRRCPCISQSGAKLNP